jgi:hypothetical protein
MNLFVKVWHGRFQDILPKKYSEAFTELLWGKIYEESVVVRIKSNLLLMIFWLHIINYNS